MSETQTRIRFVGDCGPLFAAMAKAQSEYGEIHRDKTVTVVTKAGGSYKFNYAPLENILEATLPALNKHEVFFSQPLAGKTLFTILAHSSGCRMEMEADLTGSDDIKAFGGEITYLRRYCGQTVLGVSAEQDDDGNMAAGDQREVSERPKRPACPKCGKTSSVIPGQEQYDTGGMWVCWKKREGCDHKWPQNGSTAHANDPVGTNGNGANGSEEKHLAVYNGYAKKINLVKTRIGVTTLYNLAKKDIPAGPLLEKMTKFCTARMKIIEDEGKPKDLPSFKGVIALTGTQQECDEIYSQIEASDMPDGDKIEAHACVELRRDKIEAAQAEPINA